MKTAALYDLCAQLTSAENSNQQWPQSLMLTGQRHRLQARFKKANAKTLYARQGQDMDAKHDLACQYWRRGLACRVQGFAKTTTATGVKANVVWSPKISTLTPRPNITSWSSNFKVKPSYSCLLVTGFHLLASKKLWSGLLSSAENLQITVEEIQLDWGFELKAQALRAKARSFVPSFWTSRHWVGYQSTSAAKAQPQDLHFHHQSSVTGGMKEFTYWHLQISKSGWPPLYISKELVGYRHKCYGQHRWTWGIKDGPRSMTVNLKTLIDKWVTFHNHNIRPFNNKLK